MRENWSSGFPTRTDMNRSVQSYKKAGGLNIPVAKIKALISCAVTLICAFVFT